MKLLKILFTLILFFIIAVTLILGYFGFIPGLSTILGADKPKDLGVRYTQANWQAGRNKSQVKWATLPRDTPVLKSLQYSGQVTVNKPFTNEEMSALMNDRPWRYYPVKNVQAKFNADGTAEVSGLFIKNRAIGFLDVLGVPKEAIDYIEKTLSILPSDIPFYIKGKAALTNNKISVAELNDLQIGRIPAPVQQVNQYKSEIVSLIDGYIGGVPGFFAKDAHFEEGKLVFDGTMAETESVLK